MSPELEELLEAYHEKLTCPPAEKRRWTATFESRLQAALARKPGVNRDDFLAALRERYCEFRRARRKPPTMPPIA